MTVTQRQRDRDRETETERDRNRNRGQLTVLFISVAHMSGHFKEENAVHQQSQNKHLINTANH